VLPLLWASETPYGRDVDAYLRDEDRIMRLAREEGVERLVDLIR